MRGAAQVRAAGRVGFDRTPARISSARQQDHAPEIPGVHTRSRTPDAPWSDALHVSQARDTRNPKTKSAKKEKIAALTQAPKGPRIR